MPTLRSHRLLNAYTMTLGAANNDVTPTATAPDFSVSLVYS